MYFDIFVNGLTKNPYQLVSNRDIYSFALPTMENI